MVKMNDSANLIDAIVSITDILPVIFWGYRSKITSPGLQEIHNPKLVKYQNTVLRLVLWCSNPIKLSSPMSSFVCSIYGMCKTALKWQKQLLVTLKLSKLAPNSIAWNGCLHHDRFFDFKGGKTQNSVLLFIRPQQRCTIDLSQPCGLVTTWLGGFLHKICCMFKCNMP